MRVLFDLSATQPNLGKYHGGSEYAKAILYQLLRVRQHEVLSCFFDPSCWLDPIVERRIQEAGVPLIEVEDNRVLQALVDSGEYDRLYSALPYRYCHLDFSSLEFISSILGLRVIEMPTDRYELVYGFSLLELLKYAYKNLSRRRHVESKKSRFARLLNIPAKKKTFIAISNHTKYSLLSSFPSLKPEDILMMYAPRTRRDYAIPQAKEQCVDISRGFDVMPNNYFLLVSSNRWVKNVFRAIKALDAIFLDYPNLDKKVLVLGAESPPFQKFIKNKSRFIFFGYVSDMELELLYQAAYVFVYPTLNEGFGYPPLEAMKYGTPVICSAIASTVEVCGDAALYFNPFSIDEIKNRALYMMFEPGVLERYSALGKKHSALMAAKQDRMLSKLCHLILAF